MKALWALVLVLFTFTMAMEEAHAKRLGGGKSFGSSYRTAPAPAPARSTADAPAQRQQADAAKPAQQGAGKSGLMGGLLGGMLMGGLFAALFAGGAFEGLQLADILIIAVLAFLVLKVVRGLRQGPAVARAPQPAYVGAGRQTPPPADAAQVFGARRETPVVAPSAGSDAVPFRLPQGFDTPAFIEGAKQHYRILQDAWNRNDLATIREYMSPDLYAELCAERASLASAPQTEVLSLDAELVRADQLFGNAELSIRFSGRCRDAADGAEEEFTDIWHLERDCSRADAPWFITGMQPE